MNVSQLAQKTKQPRMGYLPVQNMQVMQLTDFIEISSADENVTPVVVGLAVNYLARYVLLNNDVANSFKTPIFALNMLRNNKEVNYLDKVKEGLGYVQQIKGLDDESIIAACKLCSINCVYTIGYIPSPMFEDVNPDATTISHIKRMVERTVEFFTDNGPIVKAGFDFKGGYTDVVDEGEADYLTQTAIWDLQVSKSEPSSKYTLKLLIYQRLGVHSDIADLFKTVNNLGIYNPRTNKAYVYDMMTVPIDVINTVDYEVIGYDARKIKKLNPAEELLNSTGIKFSEDPICLDTLNQNDIDFFQSLKSDVEIANAVKIVQATNFYMDQVVEILKDYDPNKAEFATMHDAIKRYHPRNMEQAIAKLRRMKNLYEALKEKF